jgi:hypothetical protein
MTAPIRSMPELLAAFRARVEELDIPHVAIEEIGLLPDGYVSKVLAPNATKIIGMKALGGLLDGLDCEIELRPKDVPGKRFRERFVKRKIQPRFRGRKVCSSLLLKPEDEPNLQAQLERTANLRKWGQMGGKASAKRRMKTMNKATRQRIASHAARKRWSKSNRLSTPVCE